MIEVGDTPRVSDGCQIGVTWVSVGDALIAASAVVTALSTVPQLAVVTIHANLQSFGPFLGSLVVFISVIPTPIQVSVRFLYSETNDIYLETMLLSSVTQVTSNLLLLSP